MTIAQVQNLKAFVDSRLTDVVNWSRHVRIDDDAGRKSTADHAFITIKTDHNRYQMSVCSTYIEPPAGAPIMCRSLGTITFDDAAGDKHIIGPKSDQTLIDIAAHIHSRELTDALAAARREAAEAPPERAASVRIKLADIAAKAARHGIKIRDGEDKAAVAPSVAEIAAAPSHHGVPIMAIGADLDRPIARPDGFVEIQPPPVPHDETPWLGCPVIFITNPGEAISGMQEIPGHVVKILPGDRIAMFMTPDHSEPRHADNLPRRGSDAGNGRVHRFNCWDFNPHYARQLARIRHLEEAIDKISEEGNADRAALDALTQRVTELEEAATKPKRKRETETAREPELVS